MENDRMNRTQIRVFKMGEEPDDVFFWLEKTPLERLQALESIRHQYNNWKYGPQSGDARVERVFRIVSMHKKG